VDVDTADNLIKMALHVIKGIEEAKLKNGLSNVFDLGEFDLEDGKIEERVSQVKAVEFHEEWRKILLAA